MPLKLSRRQYAEMFGPTVGDRVRLADTDLFVQVERDLVAEGGGYGNEIKFGGGKVIRDGMGQSQRGRAQGHAQVALPVVRQLVEGWRHPRVGSWRRARQRDGTPQAE